MIGTPYIRDADEEVRDAVAAALVSIGIIESVMGEHSGIGRRGATLRRQIGEADTGRWAELVESVGRSPWGDEGGQAGWQYHIGPLVIPEYMHRALLTIAARNLYRGGLYLGYTGGHPALVDAALDLSACVDAALDFERVLTEPEAAEAT